MTPALAFSVSRVRDAWRIGGRLLRRTWLRCAPYAFAPPLALHLVAVFPSGGWLIAFAEGSVTTLVTLAFAGATARFYLRHVPVDDPRGSAVRDTVPFA